MVEIIPWKSAYRSFSHSMVEICRNYHLEITHSKSLKSIIRHQAQQRNLTLLLLLHFLSHPHIIFNQIVPSPSTITWMFVFQDASFRLDPNPSIVHHHII